MEKNVEQALNSLYLATRQAPLSADEHDAVKKAALIIQDALTPKKEGKTNKKK